MTSRLHLAALAVVAALAAVTGSFAAARVFSRADAAHEMPASREGRLQTYWPGGVLKSDIVYRNDVYDCCRPSSCPLR